MADFHQEFNAFQTAFYTDIQKFSLYTNHEYKKHGYTLLHNIGKGYPALCDKFLNLEGYGWKFPESPALLKAIQKQFINGFNIPRVPQFIYYPSIPLQKSKVKETAKGLIFNKELQLEICSILKIDSKTYEYLCFSEKIQTLGKQLLGNFVEKEKTKSKKKK